jgi:hypothetical protein
MCSHNPESRRSTRSHRRNNRRRCRRNFIERIEPNETFKSACSVDPYLRFVFHR